jgi:putative flippase GtrA
MVYMAHRARFAAVMTAITRRLPFGLSEVVAPSLVGYLLINLCTFFIDLALLGVFHGTFRWPIAAAVTLSYGTASVISYTANRVLNFGSHEAVGRQFPLYVLVSGSNYLIFVLGLTDLLSAAGVYYEFSRVLAACCEAVYLYCMLRWVVFRDTTGDAAAGTGPGAAEAGPARAQLASAEPASAEPASGEPGDAEPPSAEPGEADPVPPTAERR